jgi:putative CocE/NonD family hydrolase
LEKVRTDFPYEVDVIDPWWIVLADGTRIGATIWRPKTSDRVPAVVEMIPYRRRDGTVLRDLDLHPYLAGCGIAAIRVDIRGTGDSDGHLADEYLPQEQIDACEIIAWIATQDWSNGKVGMTGISWGGFNSLQVAARRPPALKAIMTLCASDDRYADDIHYMGGALITEQEMWSNFMLVKKAMPPDPQIVGPVWQEMWQQRLDSNRSLSEIWLSHQRRDDYWKQGSVCEDYARISCAVFAICGWEDSYSNFVPRLLEHLECPRLGLMGTWSHAFPNRGAPGPHIGYLQEALRWWKYWLSGEETGIMSEPQYRVWITGEERPRPYYVPDHAGGWAAEDSWPSPRIRREVRFLNQTGLGAKPEEIGARAVRSPATAGIDCGRWGGYGGTCPDMAIDQRREDGQALCFDTAPLSDDTVILGAPIVDLDIEVDQPHVNVTARLCDVYPDGTSAMMTYGVLNLSHRRSHERPEPCPVGERFRVTLRLNDFGRLVPKGHRIRLALATQHWPIVWPQPKLATLAVHLGTSAISLPVRPPNPKDKQVRFEPAEIAPPVPSTELAPGFDRRTITDDVGTGMRTITLVSDHGRHSIDDRAIVIASFNRDEFTIHPDDPLSAKLVTEYQWAIKSGEADTEARSTTELTADETHFHLTWRIEAREGGKLVHSNGATRKIPRDFC